MNHAENINKGAVFVGECYMRLGYETVFRREHKNDKSLDLTIKTSDDISFVKNIEVKTINSESPSQVATQIKRAEKQFFEGDTVALYMPNHTNNTVGRDFAQKGIAEARRKGYIKGPIEVWYSDGTKQTF